MTAPIPQFVIRWMCGKCNVEHSAQGSYEQCEAVQKRLMTEDGLKMVVIYSSPYWIECRMELLEEESMPFAELMGFGKWDQTKKPGA